VPTTWNLARSQILRPARAAESRSAKVSRPNVDSSSLGRSDRSLVRSASRVLTHRLRRPDATSRAPPVRLGVQVGDALPCKLTGQAGKHSFSLPEALTSSRTRIR
jgi:hypothetical protein